MGTPLWVTNFFPLAAFRILSLSLTFGILISVYLKSGPLCIHLVWDSLCFLDLHVYFLHQIRAVFFHYFSIDFQFLALSIILLAPL